MGKTKKAAEYVRNSSRRIRFSSKDVKAIQQSADALGITFGEFVVKAVDEYLVKDLHDESLVVAKVSDASRKLDFLIQDTNMVGIMLYAATRAVYCQIPKESFPPEVLHDAIVKIADEVSSIIDNRGDNFLETVLSTVNERKAAGSRHSGGSQPVEEG